MRRGRRRIELAAAPIDVGPILREWLFDKTPTVVLTSATLSIGHTASFDFFKSRIGLTQSDSLRLGSPFDYQRQAELILLDGMPDPADREHYDRCGNSEMIRRYVARTDGHAFVLLTSYDMMRRVARGAFAVAGGEKSGDVLPKRRHAAELDDRAVQGKPARRAAGN